MRRRATATTLCAVAVAVGPAVGLAGAAPSARTSATPSGSSCQDWSTFGHDARHSFASAGACAGVTRSTVSRLAPAWFTPLHNSVTASPTIVGDTAWVGAWDGAFYALDVTTGAIRWTFQTRAHAPTAFGRIVSSAAVTDWPVHGGVSRRVVIFGGGSSVWALDAATGEELASLDVDPRSPELRTSQDASANPPAVEVESSPVLTTVGRDRRILVGMDVHNASGVGRTGLLSLALTPAKTGPWSMSMVWKHDAETGTVTTGTAGLTAGSGQGRGCGGVWSSPAVDQATAIAVFGTASCSHPTEQLAAGENYEEGMVAVDTRTGRRVWRFTPGDSLVGDAAKIADANRDADFGASPNIFSVGGHLVVGEGRKSGDYVVRDLRTGAPVSITQAGPEGYANPGFAVGGFLGTTAVDLGADGVTRVVGATAIPIPRSPDQVDRATWAVRALDPSTGEVLWTYRLAGPSYAHSSVVDHIAFVPVTTNSTLLALDTETGLPVWEAPLVGPPSSTAVVSGDSVLVGTGTRETDLEYKAVNHDLQTAASGVTGDSPLSPASGVQAFRVVRAPVPAVPAVPAG